MTTATAGPPAPRPGEAIDRIGVQAELFLRESYVWVTQNSLRIVVAAGIGTAIVLALLALRGLGQKLCREDGVPSFRTIVGRAISRTNLFFIVALAAEVVVGYANTPPPVDRTADFFWTIAFALQAAIWARELILGLVEHRAGMGGTDHTSLGSAMGIIRLLVSFAVFTLALVLILDNLGVNVTGLIAGLGIGGIAIGLAAKGIFDDLFAALAILFDRPFKRGDSVQWDQTSGSVEEIGLKTTRVRSITGEQVVISNANLLNKELHNLARLDRRRLTVGVGVVYELPPAKFRAIPGMLREIVESTDKCSVVRCGVTGLGASSVDFEIQFDVLSERYDEVYPARTEVCLKVLERLADEGIGIAYPTQTTYTAAPDGTLIMPYGELPDGLAPCPEKEGTASPGTSPP